LLRVLRRTRSNVPVYCHIDHPPLPDDDFVAVKRVRTSRAKLAVDVEREAREREARERRMVAGAAALEPALEPLWRS
jgi:hypothetical protein